MPGMKTTQQMRDELLLKGMAPGGAVNTNTDWRSKLVGGGIRGIIARGLLGMDPPEDMTPGERDIYENMVRLSAPAQGLGVGKAIFIGAKAKTWNKAAADQFLAMEKAGVSPEQIWRETGTFRSADGKLRQEISDVGALYRNPAQLQELGKAKKEEARELQLRMVTPVGQKDLFPKALTEAKKPAREQVSRLKAEADELMRPADVRGQSARFVLEHPELYKAYPELANIPVMQGVSGSGRGSLIGGGSDLQMAITQQGLRFDPRSTTLHEMQHAVQSLEDMAPGGSPAMAFLNPKAHEILQQLRAKASTPMSFEQFVEQYGTNANNAARYQEYLKNIPQTVAGMDRQLQHTAAMQYYNRLAGEAEARATQFRERMGPTRRAQEFPYSSYDVLPEDLIVNPPHSIGYAAGGSVQQMRDELLLKGLSGGGAVKAPVTPTGFYSPLEEAALNIQRKVGNAQAFMNDLRSVPKEHLQHAGVDKLLTSRPTITREELQQHVARAAPKVEVKVMGGGRGLPPILSDYFENTTVRQPTTTEGWIAEAARQERKARQFQAQGNDRLANRLFELADAMNQHAESGETGASATKYSKYTLPGGQNYREVLLTLPTNDARKVARRAELAELDRNRPLSDEEQKEFDSLRDFAKGGNAYRSSHWDEPNVLAHFRINDRTDKDGKKVLFVEEIQSDWGQEGKKEGFADPNKKPVSQKEFNAYIDGLLDDYVARQVRAGVSRDEATDRGIRMQLPEMAQALGRADEYARMRAGRDMDMSGTTGVPSAPFVTKTNDWVNLALKHILKTAAEEGHDRVAFVRGEQAAERYGLDKHLSRIQAKPVPGGGFELHTTAKDGRRESSVNVPPQKLKDYVGEDFANKIQQQGGGVFEGDDLRVPNTGMRKFYDELVPAQAQGLIKRFGGQMGTVHVPLEAGQISEHPGFDITPEMRQAILKPMSYKVGGAVPAMDAMRLQVWGKKTHKKDGGQVEDEYRGEHKAPGPTSGKPMHDLTDVYPEDFYGPNGFRYYADMGNDYDRKSYLTTRVARGNPQQKVWIHRAIPTDVYQRAMKSANPLQQMIRPGDWVTISKEYAKEHGEGALKGDYKIASKRVPASDLYTNGDSIHEWGYHPGQRSDKE